jgi:hypothetical protein
MDAHNTEGMIDCFNKSNWGRNKIQLQLDENGKAKLVHTVDSLLGALYIQIADMMLLGQNHEKCAECGEWFVPTRKKREGLNSFCTIAHAKKFNNRLLKERNLKK